MFHTIKMEPQNTETKDIIKIIANLWKQQDDNVKNNYNEKVKEFKKSR